MIALVLESKIPMGYSLIPLFAAFLTNMMRLYIIKKIEVILNKISKIDNII